jgi:hypothetical protein
MTTLTGLRKLPGNLRQRETNPAGCPEAATISAKLTPASKNDHLNRTREAAQKIVPERQIPTIN